MIVAIDGKRFDTEKAKRTWDMSWFNGHNMLKGTLYLSSKGAWYIETPSQWANGHRWETIDPADVLERFGQYFSEEEKEEIIDLAGLETE